MIFFDKLKISQKKIIKGASHIVTILYIDELLGVQLISDTKYTE